MGEALQELMQEDIDKKIAKTKGDMAEAMLSDGKPVEEIIKYTGVTVETLQEIADRLGLTVSVTTETVAGEKKPE